MIVCLMTLLAADAASGVALTTDAFWGSDAMEAAHRSISSFVIALAALHIVAVVVMSIVQRENLIWSMITGMKQSGDAERDPSADGID